ncbi:MAG: UvrB/UvrC motif-containing protein [Clostridia bacterium]|nr:UvrB/UvrC motif-containing protein [Clostridia bacterium]
MMCQHCQKRVANVHFTQINNNKKSEMYLCEQCAKEKGQLSVSAPLSVSDFFSGLMGMEHAGSYVQKIQPQQVICGKCGMSYEEFQKVGKLGCGNCYEEFGQKIKPLIKRLHGNVEHNGKIPARVSKDIKYSKEIEALKELLNKAIQAEEYEKAAEIRDKIKSFESKK